MRGNQAITVRLVVPRVTPRVGERGPRFAQFALRIRPRTHTSSGWPVERAAALILEVRLKRPRVTVGIRDGSHLTGIDVAVDERHVTQGIADLGQHRFDGIVREPILGALHAVTGIPHGHAPKVTLLDFPLSRARVRGEVP